MKRDDDKKLENGSVVYWSQRYQDGRTDGGKVRWRVPVRCGACGEVRDVSASVAYRSGGLCRACAVARRRTMEDEELANGSVVLWSQRYRDGRTAGGYVRRRVPVRCGVCGEVRDVSASRACKLGFTGLCSACAHLDEKIHIPKATLARLYYEEGLSTSEIDDRLGCGTAAVRRRMEEYGLEHRPPGGVSRTLVPEEVLRRWSPELVYVAGMIATDGSLRRGYNAVSFYSTDYQWIEIYLKLLQINAPVYVTAPQGFRRKTLYTVQISDPSYRAFLEEIGLTPAKSTERTLGPLNIPDVLFRDFFRACIDGDGSIGVYPRKGGSTFRLQVGLYSVCQPFLKWVDEMVERLTDLEASGLYRNSGESWELAYYGGKARRLLEWIRYATSQICLV